MENNTNIESGICICSFSFGTDRCWVFELPDENVGYISGWIFCFNTVPFFWSIAGGRDQLENAIASCYAEYLSTCPEGAKCLERDPAGEGWVLDDDTGIDFYDTFTSAISDAGFVQDETGTWERKPKKAKRSRRVAAKKPSDSCRT